MAKSATRPPNGPSTTSNKSGGGRGDNSPKPSTAAGTIKSPGPKIPVPKPKGK